MTPLPTRPDVAPWACPGGYPYGTERTLERLTEKGVVIPQ